MFDTLNCAATKLGGNSDKGPSSTYTNEKGAKLETSRASGKSPIAVIGEFDRNNTRQRN